jgi:hypothetical protein
MRKAGREMVPLVLWKAGWCCGGKDGRTWGDGPWCCGELGGAVGVRMAGREVVTPGAVESWVVLWR